jgi:hypothetical protein
LVSNRGGSVFGGLGRSAADEPIFLKKKLYMDKIGFKIDTY